MVSTPKFHGCKNGFARWGLMPAIDDIKREQRGDELADELAFGRRQAKEALMDNLFGIVKNRPKAAVHSVARSAATKLHEGGTTKAR